MFLLTGSNNIDAVMKDRSGSGVRAKEAEAEIKNLVEYLCELLPNAKINMINILPRMLGARNVVINNLNRFIESLCSAGDNINYINTEADRHLFTSTRGYRNNLYFVPRRQDVPDNVHLNRMGVVRLAKHLKYIAHH